MGKESRQKAVQTLPGGVRQYVDSLRDILRMLEAHSDEMSWFEFREMLTQRYESDSGSSAEIYANTICSLDFAERVRVQGEHERRIVLTPEGKKWLEKGDASSLFEKMHTVYTGMLETLVLVEHAGDGLESKVARDQLNALLKTDWEKPTQADRRRNWLLSMGLIERTRRGDILTSAGQHILRSYANEAESIRNRLQEILQAQEEQSATENDGSIETPGHAEANLSNIAEETPASAGVRLDLRNDHITPFLEDLVLPPYFIDKACAALSTGKHLLLVGPPGTGKTMVAHILAKAAKTEGYCDGLFSTTASADWTTFDTIGGYALDDAGKMRFRPGAFLLALEHQQWLLVDELNRGDIDNAFGELMTVLSGHSTKTPYRRDNEVISIGPAGEGITHVVPPTFRVIGTMNTWDKSSLFRLSYAVQRRFAVLYLGPPDHTSYEKLVMRWGTSPGPDPEVGLNLIKRVSSMFSRDGLLRWRELGPAIVKDMLRYIRRRRALSASPDTEDLRALAESIEMYLLSQLEGLELAPAREVYDALRNYLNDAPSDTRDATLLRYRELYPHINFEVGS